MECPHLDRVTRQGVSGGVTAPSWPSLTDPGVKLECGECGATESVWICVTCGALNCGRYIKAHGLMHKVINNKPDFTRAGCRKTKVLVFFKKGVLT